MKAIIKLLLVLLLLYASFQTGRSVWRYYALKDAVHSATLHGSVATTSELQQRIVAIAEENGVLLEPRNVAVGLDGDLTTIGFGYVDEIAITPFYSYPWTFEVSESARREKPLRIDAIR